MWIAILKARLFFPFYKAMFQFLFRYASVIILSLYRCGKNGTYTV